MMNYWLPLENIMAMHCSANVGKGGDSAGHCGEWCPSASVAEALSDETIARWDQNGDGCADSCQDVPDPGGDTVFDE